MKRALMALCLLAWSADGATYYADCGAAGGGDGSLATPWNSITQVNAKALNAGDTVLFKQGCAFAGKLLSSRSGSSGSPITFTGTGYGTGALAAIDATGQTNGIVINNVSYQTHSYFTISGQTTAGISLANATTGAVVDHVTISGSGNGVDITGSTHTSDTFSYLTVTGMAYGMSASGTSSFTGLTISNSTLSSGSQLGIYVAGNVAGTKNGLTITDTTANGNTAGGIGINRTSNLTMARVTTTANGIFGISLTDITTATCSSLTSTGNTREGLTVQGGTAGLSSAIAVSDSTFSGNSPASSSYNGVTVGGAAGGDAFTCTRCVAARNGGDGFNTGGPWTNVVWDSCLADTNGTTGGSSDGDGYTFHNTSTGTVRYSRARGNLKSAVANVDTSQTAIYYNVFSHATNGTIPMVTLSGAGTHTVYNNTIVSGAQTGGAMSFATGVTAALRNNVIVGFATSITKATATVDEDYDDVYGYATAAFSGMSAGAHTITTNPFLRSASDFHLQTGSPAIDAGVDVALTRDIDGRAISGVPDMGAYEYAGSMPRLLIP